MQCITNFRKIKFVNLLKLLCTHIRDFFRKKNTSCTCNKTKHIKYFSDLIMKEHFVCKSKKKCTKTKVAIVSFHFQRMQFVRFFFCLNCFSCVIELLMCLFFKLYITNIPGEVDFLRIRVMVTFTYNMLYLVTLILSR